MVPAEALGVLPPGMTFELSDVAAAYWRYHRLSQGNRGQRLEEEAPVAAARHVHGLVTAYAVTL